MRELIRPRTDRRGMWSEGDALEYSNPAVLGAGSYGVAMAVTTPDARRIAVKLIPLRTIFASSSDGRIAFAARELDVMDKMKAADARHVMVYDRVLSISTCSTVARECGALFGGFVGT